MAVGGSSKTCESVLIIMSQNHKKLDLALKIKIQPTWSACNSNKLSCVGEGTQSPYSRLNASVGSMVRVPSSQPQGALLDRPPKTLLCIICLFKEK